MVAIPKCLPPREVAGQILKMHKDGVSAKRIAEAALGSRHRHTLVCTIAANEHDFHPDIDEVAVARALEGDRAVWESLTHYERREVLLAVHARRQAERDENAEDRESLRGVIDPSGHVGQFNYAAPHDRTPAWLERLSDAFGYDKPSRLASVARSAAEVPA